MTITATPGLYRRIASSVTSPISNKARKEVLIEKPEDVLHIEAIELAPEILDEDEDAVEESTEPQAIPHKHPMVKVEPPTNRIAHRELKIRVWSEGRPDGHHAGQTVTWSMAPLFVRPVEEGGEAGDPEFRGDWTRAAAGHRDRFEAPAEFTATGFARVGQEQATTTVDDTGHTAIRINLPPIAFNAARISVQLEGEDAAVELIDLEVPGVIVIDPGHGGATTVGGSSPNNATSFGDADGNRTLERDLTLIFGTKLRDQLLAFQDTRSLKILMTRDTDENVGIASRAHVARDNGADIFFSIHFNGNGNEAVHGPETLIETTADGNVNFTEDQALAQRIQDALTASVPNAQQLGERGYRGIKTYAPPPSGVYRDRNLGNQAGRPNSRACLAEIEFITNPDVERDLISGEGAEANQDIIATALADALLDDLLRQP